MNHIYRYILIAFSLALFVSCEHEMILDLNTAEPHIVIDASITNNSFCYVSLTLSHSFYDNEPYETISGSTVILTNGEGRSETLREDYSHPGNYISNEIIGQTGQSYYLKVIIDGETYEADATIPTEVKMEAIHLYEIKAGDKSWYSPSVEFQDPADEKNYYYFIVTVNDKVMQSVYLSDDEYRNGKKIHRILFFDKEDNDDEELNTGDHVMVEMQTLDYGMYKFYQTWLSFAGGDANPATNFSGDVLGCFKAYNTDLISMVVSHDYIYVEDEENN